MGKDNVIDITERVKQPDYKARLRNLKVRLDLEQAKIAVSTSLLSIVLLVTLANNNLLVPKVQPTVDNENRATRGIASIPSVADVQPSEENQRLVMELARRSLSATASVGHKPSLIDKLAFGFLEGRYKVRLNAGKLSEIEFAGQEAPKKLGDAAAFIETNRELMPVAFDRSLKVGAVKSGLERLETYELVNRFSMPLAKVQLKLDSEGNLLTMRVAPMQVAAK